MASGGTVLSLHKTTFFVDYFLRTCLNGHTQLSSIPE